MVRVPIHVRLLVTGVVAATACVGTLPSAAQEPNVPSFRRPSAARAVDRNEEVNPKLIAAAATPFHELPRARDDGVVTEEDVAEEINERRRESGVSLSDLVRMGRAGYSPAFDPEIQEELAIRKKLGPVSSFVAALEKRRDPIDRVAYLNKLADTMSVDVLRQIRREYNVAYAKRQARELRRLLAAKPPDPVKTLRFLRDTLGNRTPGEVGLFVGECHAMYFPDLDPFAHRFELHPSEPPGIRKDVHEHFVQFRRATGSRLPREYTEAMGDNTLAGIEAQWLLSDTDDADAAQFLCCDIASALGIAQGRGAIIPGAIRIEKADGRKIHANRLLATAYAGFVMNVLVDLSPERRQRCGEAWQRLAAPPCALQEAINDVVKFVDHRNTERLETIWDAPLREGPPLVRELFPTDDPRWPTKPWQDPPRESNGGPDAKRRSLPREFGG